LRRGGQRTAKEPRRVEPEQAAKVAIARRTKPSALPDHVKLVLTLDLRRAPWLSG
jgi:hypothetical protein